LYSLANRHHAQNTIGNDQRKRHMPFVIPETVAKLRLSGINWPQHRLARPGPDVDAFCAAEALLHSGMDPGSPLRSARDDEEEGCRR